MPDVLLFLKASVLSFSASTVTVLTLMFLVGRRERLTATHSCQSVVLLFGCLLGAITGFAALKFQWAWPPGNALNRFLELLLPAIVFSELLVSTRRLPPWAVWMLRSAVAAAAGRVLLHGSVYLTADRWMGMPTQTALMLSISVVLLLIVWRLLLRIAETPAAAIVPFAFALSIQSVGIATMLAGYIKGGAASIPLASSVAATIASSLLVRRKVDVRGLVGVASISLYCLILIGCCFGALRPSHGVLLFFAPCLCLVSSLPFIRLQGPRSAAFICLIVVSLPLMIVLIQSAVAFRQRLAPLLSHRCATMFTDAEDV